MVQVRNVFNSKMIKILMTREAHAACSLLLSTPVHLHPCFHGVSVSQCMKECMFCVTCVSVSLDS